MKKYLYENKNYIKIFKDLKKLKKKFEHLQNPEKSVPSAPNTAIFSCLVSGSIDILINDYHRGGRYGVDLWLPICVHVGSSVDKEVHTAFEEYFKKIQDKYYFTEHKTNAEKNIRYFNCYGTSYCIYGLNTDDTAFSDSAKQKIKEVI